MFGKIALRFTKKYVLKKIGSKDFKERLIRIINSKVDIPKLNEKQEETLIRSILDAIIKVVF